MSESNSPYSPAPVRDQRTTPPGILPKNIQSWVLIGIALVMILIITLSGKNPPKEQRPEIPAGSVVDPNAARIQEYQKRMEEQTRKLQAEQAELARTQAVLGPSSGTRIAASQGSLPESYRGAVPGYVSEELPSQTQALRLEKEKREYESLFASNIVLSYRPATKVAASGAAPQSPSSMAALSMTPAVDEALARILPFLSSANPALSPAGLNLPAPPLLSAPATAAPRSGTHTSEPDGVKGLDSEAIRPVPASDPELTRAEGKSYRVFEGTVIETVLTNRLDGAFSGPVNCMVTTNVYSHNGQHLLIPQGSRILGEVRKVETFGQERLAVFFHRLIMPDGYSLSLDHFQGLNQIGETGLRDQVNHHYLQVFGVSLAIGAVAGAGQANTGSGFDRTGFDAYEQGIATSLSQSSLRILDRYLNVLPTFKILEGHRVKVYLSGDLQLPAYDNHKVAADL